MTTGECASRFMKLVDSFLLIDNLLLVDNEIKRWWKSYRKLEKYSTIEEYLKDWVSDKTKNYHAKSRLVGNETCICIPPIYKKGIACRPDGRFTLGADFVAFWIKVQEKHELPWQIQSNGTRDPSGSKVTISWIIAAINTNFPNEDMDGWQNFEYSHRCGRQIEFCLEVECGVWESRSINQSRSGSICRRKCNHCNELLCACQGIHNPHCF